MLARPRVVRQTPMRLAVLVALGSSCAPPAANAPDQGKKAEVAQPATKRPPSWLLMGDAALAIPEACSATCELECDVWKGTLKCGATQWSLYGGLDSMAGMGLDQRGSIVEGSKALAGTARLRWGTSAEAKFCADFRHDSWTWQICGSNEAVPRRDILALANGYAVGVPNQGLIACPQSGC